MKPFCQMDYPGHVCLVESFVPPIRKLTCHVSRISGDKILCNTHNKKTINI